MIIPLILLASLASSSPIGYTAGLTCAAFMIGSRCTSKARPPTNTLSNLPTILQPTQTTSTTLLYAPSGEGPSPKTYDWEQKRPLGKKHEFAKDDTIPERMAKLYYRNKAYLDLELNINGVPSTMLSIKFQREKTDNARIDWAPCASQIPNDPKGQARLARVVKALDDDMEEARNMPFNAGPSKAAGLFGVLMGGGKGGGSREFGNESDVGIEGIRHRASAWELGFD